MTAKNTATEPLEPVVQRQLVDFVASVGDVMAATEIGMSRFAVCRALGGLPVRPGTRALIENYFVEKPKPLTASI